MRLKGFSHVGEYLLCDQLESNLISFFNWGFLQAGSYFNEQEELIPVSDPSFPYVGRVFTPSRKSMVWETGILYSPPPQALEVRVNDVIVSNYIVDYARGYIIFNTIPVQTPTIKYAYRYYNFVSSEQEWYKRVVLDSFRVNETTTTNSNIQSILNESQIQMPVVVVQTEPRRQMYGAQLGGGHVVEQDVLFSIFTENSWGRKKLMDAITYQIDKTLPLYDLNKVAQDNKLSLNDDGSFNSTSVDYETLIDRNGPYFWRNCFFKKFTIQETLFLPPIYQAQIRATIEVRMNF